MITMPQPPSAVSWLAGIAAVMLSACSGAPTPAPSKTPTAAPSPSSTPLPPDTQTVAVVEIGIGTFDLAAFPVASLKNEAMYHAAASVVVHFVTHRAGRTLGSLDSVPVNLAPGEALAVTADCTDACTGAASVSVSVAVGSWTTSVGPAFPTASATYACQPCHSGHGYGDVKGTITPSSTISAGVAVVAFAVCKNGAGVIVGGGSEQFIWQAGASLAADVPVVLSAAPSSCAIGASTGW
jgi:hypothetical protein